MRYPTRNGLVIPVEEMGYTPTERVRRATTNHHNYWERDRYNDVRFRSVFRNLVTNVTTLLIPEHVDLHERFDAPKRPSDVLMIDVVEEYLSLHGAIHCVKEKRTNEVYQIEAPEWEHIKGMYRLAA